MRRDRPKPHGLPGRGLDAGAGSFGADRRSRDGDHDRPQRAGRALRGGADRVHGAAAMSGPRCRPATTTPPAARATGSGRTGDQDGDVREPGRSHRSRGAAGVATRALTLAPPPPSPLSLLPPIALLQSSGIGGASCQRLARLSRSNAEAQTPSPPPHAPTRAENAPAAAAPRPRSPPPLPLSGVFWVVLSLLFSIATHPGFLSVAPRATATRPPRAWPPLDLASPGV